MAQLKKINIYPFSSTSCFGQWEACLSYSPLHLSPSFPPLHRSKLFTLDRCKQPWVNTILFHEIKIQLQRWKDPRVKLLCWSAEIIIVFIFLFFALPINTMGKTESHYSSWFTWQKLRCYCQHTVAWTELAVNSTNLWVLHGNMLLSIVHLQRTHFHFCCFFNAWF